jgi:hypothetical protein
MFNTGIEIGTTIVFTMYGLSAPNNEGINNIGIAFKDSLLNLMQMGSVEV